MWPFKRQQTPSVTPAPAVDPAVESLERRVRTLEGDLAAVRREWADTLDKLQTWFGRQAARKRQQLHRDLEAQETASEAAGPTNGHEPISKAELRKVVAQRRFQGNLG